jgi:hypothetical protein
MPCSGYRCCSPGGKAIRALTTALCLLPSLRIRVASLPHTPSWRDAHGQLSFTTVLQSCLCGLTADPFVTECNRISIVPVNG